MTGGELCRMDAREHLQLEWHQSLLPALNEVMIKIGVSISTGY